MSRLLLWIIDRPHLTLGAVLVVTVALGLHIPRLSVDTSLEALMIEGDPERAYYEQVKAKFGSDDLTIILVKAPDVFTAPVLGVVQRLSDALGRDAHISRVDSLTTLSNIKGEDDFLDTEPLLEGDPPTDPAALAALRRDALRNPIFVHNVVAADARATAILAYADTPPDDPSADRTLVADIEALIEAEREATGLEIYQIGGPFTKVTMGDFIQADQVRLTPLALLVLLGALYAMFRVAHAVLIPVATSVISIVWTLGLMAVLGYQVNVLTAAVPALLVCIGFTEDVHLINEYHEGLARGCSRLDALRGMARTMAIPIFVTALTTMVGFASLALTGVSILVQLGQVAPIGFASNLIITIVLVPGMLRYWPIPARLRQAAVLAEQRGRTQRALRALAHFDLRWRVPLMVGVGLLTLAGVFACRWVRVDSDLVSYFKEGSVIRTRMGDLHESLSGILTFSLVVESHDADRIKSPEVLRHIDALQRFVKGHAGIDATLSVADYVKTMHREMHGGDERFWAIPDDGDLIAQYLLMLDGPDLAKYVDYDYTTANVLVRHDRSSSWELRELLRDIDAWVATHMPASIRVRYTGESILINNAADAMAWNLVTGLAYTIGVVAVVNGFLFLSLKASLLSLVPNVLPVVWALGFMGVAGIPLNAGTAMLAAIAVGIAVDDTVHYMCRNNWELNRHNDQVRAMFGTIESEGLAIVTTSLALAGGFAVLAFSNFVPTAHLGFMSAIVFLVALATDLVVTPILMVTTRLVTLWHVVALKMDRDLVASAPLFRGMSRWEARKVVLLGSLQRVRGGAHVLRSGEEGGDLFMVVTGRLRVVAADGRGALAHLEAGDVFGEMGFVDRRGRSADVVAETDAEVLRMDEGALDRVRRRFPFTGVKLLRNVARILSERLRAMNRAAAVARSG